jgi:UDP-N-acetylglucosamine diphosphorylase/glucosamine-1-phosphate N-acetyltransferase
MRGPDDERPGLVLLDDGRGTFGPLTDLRAAFSLRTGAGTTAERLARVLGPAVACIVPKPLAALVAESTGLPTMAPPGGDRFLVANGRLRSAVGLPIPEPGEALVAADGSILVAHLRRTDVGRLAETGQLPDDIRREVFGAPLIASPWDLLDGLAAGLAEDIEAVAAEAGRLGYVSPSAASGRMGEHVALVHASASIAPQVVFDTSQGPVLVGPKAVIRPFTVLCGPCSIGEGSIVGDRSLIKAAVSCGPLCRIGGEIGGTSIAGRSNKAHDGHLGDSVIGEWVNLGAGTDNSNLLNTYGEVSMRLEPDGPRQRTGRIFFGAVIGDHVKTAIGTRIMTGTVFGTGAMVACSTPPPSTVRRFAWLTDEGERRYELGKFVEVAKTVMARRNAVPGPALLARIAELHAIHAGSDTPSERRAARQA